MGLFTDLVKHFVGGIWQCHRLLEHLSDPFEALALGPIVEGAGNVHLFGIVRPARFNLVSNSPSQAPRIAINPPVAMDSVTES